MTGMEWVRADMDADDPESQGYSPGAAHEDSTERKHVLTFNTSRCGTSSICFYGTCSCGEWTHGPHFMIETVQAYWHDHVHLTDERECALHGVAS